MDIEGELEICLLNKREPPRQNALATGSLLKENVVRHVDWDVA